MNVIEHAEDVLKAIESAVVHASVREPAVTNYTVLRAYEAAIAHYHAMARQQQPKPAGLSGLEATIYEAVRRACESRIGKPVSSEQDAALLSVEDLVACLRRLKKSVDF